MAIQVGDKFGRLTITGFEMGRPIQAGKAHVICECGAQKSVRLAHLVSGTTLSCGCVKRIHFVEPGQVYGRLTVLTGELDRSGDVLKTLCRCACGVEKLIGIPSLCTGVTKSCGCLVVETIRSIGLRHGYEQHPAYKVWSGIRERCFNPKSKSYGRYGARGITMCAEWANDCKAFCDWAAQNGHEAGLEIDRRENSGNYEPSNCHFVTSRVNSRNRRSNIPVTAFGETKLIVEWSEDDRCVVPYEVLRIRIHRGVAPELAMSTPRQAGVPIRP